MPAKILDVNIKSAALLVKEAYPHLKAGKNPSVVIVSSIGGLAPFAVSDTIVTYCPRAMCIGVEFWDLKFTPGRLTSLFSFSRLFTATWTLFCKQDSTVGAYQSTVTGAGA